MIISKLQNFYENICTRICVYGFSTYLCYRISNVADIINLQIMNTLSKTIEQQTFELLETTGLNWTVDKKPLFANKMDPTGTIPVGTVPTQSFGIFRNDNENWLGTVGSQYAPFQNHELVQMMVEATEQLDMHKRTGGALYGGGRVFLKIELPSTHIGESPVRRFATANNSHDGSSSISFGLYSEVQVCTNGMYREYDRVTLGKIRHTANYKDRVKSAIEALKNLMGLDNKLMDNFKRMADIKANDEMIERVMRRIFEVDLFNSPIKEKAPTKRKFNPSH